MTAAPFSLRLVRGAIAGRFVVKHYRYGVVITNYPQMKGIAPSAGQRLRRRLFTLSVRYAKKVFANARLKEKKRKLLRRPKRLFQALMKEWFSRRKQREAARERRREGWRRKVKESLSAGVVVERWCGEGRMWEVAVLMEDLRQRVRLASLRVETRFYVIEIANH